MNIQRESVYKKKCTFKSIRRNVHSDNFLIHSKEKCTFR